MRVSKTPTDNKVITVKEQDGIAVITIEREAAMNALNQVVLSRLADVITELEQTQTVRVVIITGAGQRAFVAGADIKEMIDLSPSQATRFAELGAAAMAKIEDSRKPYLAAVNGFALGGGCELALACDCIYASTNAKFGQPEVKLGVIPGFGGSQRLPARVGLGRALDLIMTGRIISAQHGYEIGLVDRLFEPGDLLDEVRGIARQIVGNGAAAVAEAKRVVRAGQAGATSLGVALEQRSFGGLFATSDQSDRMRAFVDKANR